MKEYKVYLSNQAKEDIANIYGYKTIWNQKLMQMPF